MRLFARIVGIVVLLIVLALIGVAWWGYGLTRPAGGGTYRLEVKPGDTLAQVAATLQARHIVKSADALRLLLRFRGTAGSLEEGYYRLNGNQSLFGVADSLNGTPTPRIVSVTIPEGKRIKDLPAIFEKAHLSTPADLRKALNDAELSQYAKGNLEGFVFPATYPFRPEATAQEIVKTLVDRMDQEITPDRIASAKRLHLSVYGWLTLASMVQAEAGDDSQMPVIAGIFLNRLKKDIALGCDPTVAYGLGKNLNQLDRYAGDFKKDTPYNTYTRLGLPKGPIDNPGEAAMLSVLSPKLSAPDGGPALYFVHGTDGVLHVNSTYANHLKAVQQYR